MEIGICGSVPFLEWLEVNLRVQEGLRISCLGDSLAAAVQEIAMAFPQAVVFEMEDISEPLITEVLRQHPEIRLIGLGADKQAITVFSVDKEVEISTDELGWVLQESSKRGW